MKGLPTLIRVRNWELEEKRRKLADLETLEARLVGAIEKLDEDVRHEQQVASNNEGVRHAYAAFANAAIERRRTLEASLADVRRQVEDAMEEVRMAYQELKKFEIAQEARVKRARAEMDRREQIRLDDIALEGFRRAGSR